MSIKPAYTTMGQSTPATVSDDAADAGAGFYRYKKDRTWKPNDPRYPKGDERPAEPSPQNVKAIAGRAARLAEFRRMRLDGVSKEDAAAALGISRSTMQDYEREFKYSQRGDSA